MNREALDAWFAEADDVLNYWPGSADAATYFAPEVSNDWASLRPHVTPAERIMAQQGIDGYAATALLKWQVGHAVESLQATVAELGKAFAKLGHAVSRVTFNFPKPTVPSIPTGPADQRRQRALAARRNRNNGPPLPGMDGRLRR